MGGLRDEPVIPDVRAAGGDTGKGRGWLPPDARKLPRAAEETARLKTLTTRIQNPFRKGRSPDEEALAQNHGYGCIGPVASRRDGDVGAGGGGEGRDGRLPHARPGLHPL